MDVKLLRSLLMEIGQPQYNQITDERRTVTTSKKIWTLFPRVKDVIGVYSVDDVNKDTNLAPSGAHDNVTITIEGAANAGDEVLVDYVVEDGLNDDAAQSVIDWAKFEVLGQIDDASVDIVNGTSTLEELARVYWQMLALINAYLIMNNVNFIQSDANMALFNFQTMSKLWGEGMSTGELFDKLMMRLAKIDRVLMMLTMESDTFVPDDTVQYWEDGEMLSDWLSTYGETGTGNTTAVRTGYGYQSTGD